MVKKPFKETPVACQPLKEQLIRANTWKKGLTISTIGLAIALILMIVIPSIASITNPFGTCNMQVGFAVDEDFSITVYNGTDGTPIHEDSDQFESLITILSIIEFDPIIIQAYKDNITEGIPLNETITENVGTYMSYKNVFICNAKLQLFLTELFEGINGTLPEPTEEEILELLLPLERESYVRTKTSIPCLLAGATVLLGNTTWLNNPESINITDFMEIFNNTYAVNMAFLDTENLINLGIPEALESPFFVDTCHSLDFKLTGLDFNTTIVDDLPMSEINEWTGEINGVAVSGTNDEIPLNIPNLFQMIPILGDIL